MLWYQLYEGLMFKKWKQYHFTWYKLEFYDMYYLFHSIENVLTVHGIIISELPGLKSQR